MAKKPSISKQEQELFRQATKGTKPLKTDKLNLRQTPTKKSPIKTQETYDDNLNPFSDFEIANPVAADETLFYSQQGVQHKIIQKLKRGQFPIEARLDLHGSTIDQARDILFSFLKNCQAHHMKVIIIVHGKGYRSQTQRPMIKNKVNTWLRQTDQVNAFCSAQAKDGGTGAVYVLLKQLS